MDGNAAADDRLRAISEVCSMLEKAFKAVQFYPEDHRLARSAREELATALRTALSDGQTLALHVGESALLFEGEEVLRSEDPQEGLPLLLYRDGIRTILLHPGLPRTEIDALVDTLVQARGVNRSEHDVVTLLWEQNFNHIDCIAVDPLLERDYDSRAEAARVAATVRGQIEERASAEMAVAHRPGDHAEADLLAEDPSGLLVGSLVDPSELERLRREIQEEGDPLEEFGVILVEMLTGAPSDDRASEAATSLRGLVDSYTEWGEFEQLALLAQQLLNVRSGLGPRKTLVQPLLDEIVSFDRLEGIVSSLEGAQATRRRAVERFLAAMREEAYPELVELLAQARGRRSRKTLLNVLGAGEGVPLELLLPKLQDPRWYVVRNMVYLVGRTGDASALDKLEEVLDHSDERVRAEVVRALAAIGGSKAYELIARALKDPSSTVRTLAARRLMDADPGVALRPLHAEIMQRDFPTRSEREVSAFLETLGALGTDETVELLENLWEKRELLQSKPMHIRLGAIRALAEIGGAEALTSLQKASRSREQQIRNEAEACASKAKRGTVQ